MRIKSVILFLLLIGVSVHAQMRIGQNAFVGQPLNVNLKIFLWYLENENGGGFLYDSGPNGYNATLVNGFWTTNPAGIASLQFNAGAPTYAYTSGIQWPQTGFTVSEWFFAGATNVDQDQCDSYSGSDGYFQFPFYYGQFRARILCSSAVNYIGRWGPSLNSNQWYHVAYTWGGGSTAAAIAIYTNGVQCDYLNDNNGTFTNPSVGSVPLYLGVLDVAQVHPLAGRMSDVRIWSRALAPQEIGNLTLSGPAPLYRLSVVNGTGSGSYSLGAHIAIATNGITSFTNWSASAYAVNLANSNSGSTTWTMPATNVTLTANGTTPPVTNNWITSLVMGTLRVDGPYCIGTQFTIGSTNITVIALGRYNCNTTNVQTHPIGLWNSTGTLLASTSVNALGAGIGFQTGAITPTTLTAGATYYVATIEGLGDQWFGFEGSETFTGAATENGAYYTGASVLTWPSNSGGSGNLPDGVTFIYQ
jgi:hypothetical protein